MSQTQHDFASPNSDLNLYNLGQSYFDDAFFDPVVINITTTIQISLLFRRTFGNQVFERRLR